MPLIDEGIRSAGLQLVDLAAVSVSIGPGSYTGLRVGLSTAKGICYAAGIPLIAVDTLESLADKARENISGFRRYVAFLDARRMDAYMAIFEADGSRGSENRFVTLSQMQACMCGEGLGRLGEFDLSGIEVKEITCDARNLVRLATKAFDNQDFADLASCVPGYLKAPNITTPA